MFLCPLIKFPARVPTTVSTTPTSPTSPPEEPVFWEPAGFSFFFSRFFFPFGRVLTFGAWRNGVAVVVHGRQEVPTTRKGQLSPAFRPSGASPPVTGASLLSSPSPLLWVFKPFYDPRCFFPAPLPPLPQGRVADAQTKKPSQVFFVPLGLFQYVFT